MPRNGLENTILYGLIIDGDEVAQPIYVLNKFSAADILAAKECETFVEGLIGTNFTVEYNNFYWATNISEKYIAVTLMDHPKAVLFKTSLKPPNDGPYYQYYFGVTILHEWMHYHYGMHHPHVQNLIDNPAVVAYREWYVEHYQTNR